ncbi:MAG: hypothetical protein GY945_01765 [Rhodobacteraceae bacterium]|nr:hypothetical protein [Paracoccaceae bacterium]
MLPWGQSLVASIERLGAPVIGEKYWTYLNMNVSSLPEYRNTGIPEYRNTGIPE